MAWEFINNLLTTHLYFGLFLTLLRCVQFMRAFFISYKMLTWLVFFHSSYRWSLFYNGMSFLYLNLRTDHWKAN